MNQDDPQAASRVIWQQVREATERLEAALAELRQTMGKLAPPEHRAAVLPPLTAQETLKATKQVRPWLREQALRNSRTRTACEMRQLGWLAMQLSGRSYSEIGRDWGGKDHTSVIYGCRRAVERLEQGDLRDEWIDLLQALDRRDLAELWRAFTTEVQQDA